MKIAFIIGTRPDAIKMAPVIKKFYENNKFHCYIISTAQHREMLDNILNFFEIVPDFDLNVMSKNQNLTELSIKLLNGLEKIYKKIKPDITFVQGDTTSSFIAALISYYHKIPICHIEAGLRTHDKYNPFPEEINRKFIDSISDFCFAPTQDTKQNLLNEGIKEDKIFITGNTGIDALKFVLKQDREFQNKNLQDLDTNKRLITVTVHRRESFGKPLRNIINALKNIVTEYKDYNFVIPVHPNPNVSELVIKTFKKFKNVILTSFLSYPDFVKLLNLSYLIITDSGGIQEEAPYLGKPVLVVREITERKEIEKLGGVKVISREKDEIIKEFKNIIENTSIYEKMAIVREPYGTGNASEIIFKIIKGRQA
jgi:UDP-N-acetylglucosamine 2-epimerase (non-hydrolysing)